LVPLWRSSSCAQSAYCAVFLRYVQPGAKKRAFVRALLIASTCALVFLCIVFALIPRAHPLRRQCAAACLRLSPCVAHAVCVVCTCAAASATAHSPLVGYVADVLNIAMYSSPLAVMSTVVRTRSVEFMPLGLSLGTLGCAASWSVFAIYVGDATILIPNILGVALALAQLALYARYYKQGSGSGGGGGGGAAQGEGSVRDGGDGMGGGPRSEREGARLLPEEADGAGGAGGGPLPYAPPAPDEV
jgi:solute carrier family 50 protein (sugar transporter)